MAYVIELLIPAPVADESDEEAQGDAYTVHGETRYVQQYPDWRLARAIDNMALVADASKAHHFISIDEAKRFLARCFDESRFEDNGYLFIDPEQMAARIAIVQRPQEA